MPTLMLPYQAFATADGHIIILAIGNDEQFRKFCQKWLVKMNGLRIPAMPLNAARVNSRLQSYREKELLLTMLKHAIASNGWSEA